MIAVGLTGGIATGKSTVAKFFKAAGAAVVDADKLARAAVGQGLPAWQAIIDHFGRGILLPDGELDRGALGEIIFNDSKQKDVLNQIVHPHVMRAIDDRLAAIEKRNPEAVVMVDIPLLIEIGMHHKMPEVIVVYVPENLQFQRLMARDGLTREAALARIRSQIPIEKKKKRASMVIDNSGTVEHTRQQVFSIYQRLRVKAGKK